MREQKTCADPRILGVLRKTLSAAGEGGGCSDGVVGMKEWM